MKYTDSHEDLIQHIGNLFRKIESDFQRMSQNMCTAAYTGGAWWTRPQLPTATLGPTTAFDKGMPCVGDTIAYDAGGIGWTVKSVGNGVIYGTDGVSSCTIAGWPGGRHVSVRAAATGAGTAPAVPQVLRIGDSFTSGGGVFTITSLDRNRDAMWCDTNGLAGSFKFDISVIEAGVQAGAVKHTPCVAPTAAPPQVLNVGDTWNSPTTHRTHTVVSIDRTRDTMTCRDDSGYVGNYTISLAESGIRAGGLIHTPSKPLSGFTLTAGSGTGLQGPGVTKVAPGTYTIPFPPAQVSGNTSQITVGSEWRARTGFQWRVVDILGNKVKAIATVGNQDWATGSTHTWDIRVLDEAVHTGELTRVVLASLPATPRKILSCSGGCGIPNEYAEPNQPDGTYRCYGCRS